MNFLIPIAAAFLQAASSTLDKVVLSLRGVNYQLYNGASFPLFFLALALIAFVVQPPFSLALLQGTTLLLLVGSVALVLITNLLYYRALDGDRLSEMQIIGLLYYIPAILYAGILFPDERNPLVFVLALIIFAAIIWSHWERHHFHLHKKTLPFFVWTVTLAPFQEVITKMLLQTWHPLTLLLTINGVMALALSPFLVRFGKRLTAKSTMLLVLLNALSACAWVLYFVSYQRSGVVYTILLFSLMPLLVYFASVVFLKERLQWKKFIAFLIVLAAITLAQFAAS